MQRLHKSDESRASLGFSWLHTTAAVISLIGLADALYLTVEHITGANVRCTITSGCNEVLGSSYAAVKGYPVAAIGALTYFTVFCVAILIAFGYRSLRHLLAALIAAMVVATLWFLYIQAFILHSFCQYCLLSAAVTLLLGIINGWELTTRRTVKLHED